MQDLETAMDEVFRP